MAIDFEEMRSRLIFARDEWKHNFEQGDIDLLYATGDPFRDVDKAAWVAATGRPPFVTDELGQHLNRIRNHPLSRPRGINITPTNTQASEITAADRTDIIRGIEYQGNAQAPRLNAYISMVESGIGVYGISKTYRYGSRHMDIKYRTFPDRKQVLVDPLIVQPDGSDMKYAFVRSPRPKKEFQREYGKDARADASGLQGDEFTQAAMWFQTQAGCEVIVETEYWKIDYKDETLHFIDIQPTRDRPAGGELDISDSDIRAAGLGWSGGWLFAPMKDGGWHPIGPKVGERKEKCPSVYSCITNGYDDLKTTPWDTKQIPLILMLGKQSFVTRGGVTRREVLSLIRLARDPYLMLCYVRNKQLMLAGLAPIAPWIAAKGQITGADAEKWDSAHLTPYGRLEYNPTITGLKNPDGSHIILPPPQRVNFEPQIQGLEVLAEALRRQVQSAMGMSMLPASMLRDNQKSGRALEEIKDTVDQGASHFLDTYDKAIAQEGRIVNDEIDYLLSKPRDVPAVTATRKNHVLTIGREAIDPRTREKRTINLGNSQDHSVTVAAGPASESLRAEAGEFADTLLGQGGVLQLAIQTRPEVASELAGAAIRLREGGPVMDELADIIDPSDKESAQAKLGKVTQIAQQQKLMLGESQKIIDGQHQEIERLRSGIDKQQVATDGSIRVAEIKQQTDLIREWVEAQTEATRKANAEAMAVLQTQLAEIQAEMSHSRNIETMEHQAALEPEPEAAAVS